MVKLKKYRVHKAVCPTCKGNGYVKIMKEDLEPHIHQCWDCDSEGEFYVYEPQADDIQYGNLNTYKFLH